VDSSHVTDVVKGVHEAVHGDVWAQDGFGHWDAVAGSPHLPYGGGVDVGIAVAVAVAEQGRRGFSDRFEWDMRRAVEGDVRGVSQAVAQVMGHVTAADICVAWDSVVGQVRGRL